MFARFNLFKKQIHNSVKNNEKKLTNTAFGLTATALACNYSTLTNKWAEAEVSFFIKKLTPKQLNEIKNSPEKRAEYWYEHKESIRWSMRD